MASTQLSGSEKRINYQEWDATGEGYLLYTRQYAKYTMLDPLTARVYIRQVIGSVSGRGWEGTNNRYRTKSDPDTIIDSGFNTFGTISANQELQVYPTSENEGYYDITSSQAIPIMCFASTYGERYQTTSWTSVYVPSAAFSRKAATPTITIDDITASSITISYQVPNFGTSQYGTGVLYGGTSNPPTVAIDSTSSIMKRTYVFTGLDTNTTYYFRARAEVSNPVLNSDYSAVVSATTGTSKFYGSVNGETKAITKLYGSVNGQTKLITKLYGSVNGQTKRIF